MAVLGSQGFPLRLLVWPDLYSMSGLKHQRCHSYALLALWILGSSSLIEAQGLISVQNRQLSDAHRSHSQHLHTVHDINSHRQPEILHKIRPEQLQNVYKQQHPKSHRDAEAEIKEEATQLEEEIKHMELGEGLQRKNQDLLKHAAARSGGNEGKIEHGEKARADEEETLGQITSAQGTTRNLLRMGDSMPERRILAVEDAQPEKIVQNLEDQVEAVVEKIQDTDKKQLQNEAQEMLSNLRSPDLQDLIPKISWVTVLWMTLLMGGAAGIGSLPFFFVGSLSKEWAALANALACGVMLACSFDLVHEGQPYGGGSVIIGILLGTIFISSSQQYLEKFEEVRFQGLQGINARKILLMIGIMAAHAFGEGAGVGVSFCGGRGWTQGVLVTLAIGLHNVPEGLAVSTVLVARGIKPSKALLWTLFTALPQPLVAVPSFMFVDTFKALLPVALGFAAGCMVWMVFAELLPDALADASPGKVASTATLSAAWLEGLRMLLATFEGANGEFHVPPGITVGLMASGLLLTMLASASGILGGLISRFLVKSSATGLSFAAGILIWQALTSLAALRRHPESIGLLPGLSVLLLGCLAAFVTQSFVIPMTLASDIQPKEKEGGTPKKEANGIIVAADEDYNSSHLANGKLQNGFDHHYLDVESGMVSASLLRTSAGKDSLRGVIVSFSSIVPLSTLASQMQQKVVGGSAEKSHVGFWGIFVAGMAFTCGFGVLLPQARRQNWRKSIAGLTKGVVSAVLLQWLFYFSCK